jgi:hypothetical protein
VVTTYYCTRCRKILQSRDIMIGKHLVIKSDGKQTTFELCGPVVTRNLAECSVCGEIPCPNCQ